MPKARAVDTYCSARKITLRGDVRKLDGLGWIRELQIPRRQHGSGFGPVSKVPRGQPHPSDSGKDLRTKSCQVYKRQNVFDSFCVYTPSAEVPSSCQSQHLTDTFVRVQVSQGWCLRQDCNFAESGTEWALHEGLLGTRRAKLWKPTLLTEIA